MHIYYFFLHFCMFICLPRNEIFIAPSGVQKERIKVSVLEHHTNRILTRYIFSQLIPYFYPKCWSLILKMMRIWSLIPWKTLLIRISCVLVPDHGAVIPRCVPFEAFDPIYLVTTLILKESNFRCESKLLC